MGERTVIRANFQSVDEIIKVRENSHGGGPGAPSRNDDGTYQGNALNQAGIVLLSATLQGFVEEVFMSRSIVIFGSLSQDEEKRYRKTWNRWGNPSHENIKTLFRRIGVDDVFKGLSWQGQGYDALKNNLDAMNEIRNGIAHNKDFNIKNQHSRLKFSDLKRYRSVVGKFTEKFDEHVRTSFVQPKFLPI